MSQADVLIFGGFGQVGEALLATAAECGRDCERVVPMARAQADLLDGGAVTAALASYRPRAAINCAVFQPVDRCETERQQAFAVNAVAVGRLAEACRKSGTRLVHLSTDYVFFGGDRRKPFIETDLPAPLSVYGASKLAGEHLVLAASEAHAVVRTSAVYGDARPGHGTAPFPARMMQRALAGEETRVVTDQVVSPTFAEDLARAIWGILDCGGTGVFHAAGRGEATWFEVAALAFQAAGARALLRPTTAAEFGAPARRSPYTALGNARLQALRIPDLPPWRESMAGYLRRLHDRLAAGAAHPA